MTDKYFFKGNFVKVEIFLLVENGTITIREAWLLLTLDNLTHSYGQDTFISNASLGEKCQVKAMRISGMLSHLRKLGLVKTTKFNGRKRYMSVRWEASVKLIKELPKIRRQPPPTDVGSLRPQANYNTINTNKLNYIPESHGSPVIEWEKIAKKFLTATQVKRKTPPSTKTWGSQLKRFATHEEIKFDKIKKVLRWYSRQFDADNNPWHQKFLPKFIPQANSMSGFCRKFYDIEQAMGRDQAEEDGPAPGVTYEELAAVEKKIHDRMALSFNGADKTTLPVLVRALYSQTRKFREQVNNAGASEKVKELYFTGIFSSRILHVGYAMWIEKESKKWTEWGGDFSIFNPGGKHFDRYLKQTIKQSGMTVTRRLKRILDEA